MPDDNLLARARAEAQRRYPDIYGEEDSWTERRRFEDGVKWLLAQLPDREAVVDATQRGLDQYLREDIPEDGLSEAECVADAVLDLIRNGATR